MLKGGEGAMKKWIYPVSLILLFIILLAAVVPTGYVYGSNTDWLSQHVTLAETIRNACLEQHTLLPSWIGLGGGSNGYQFAYYGFLRPDILIGCLLPQIPMADIVTAYMTAVFLSSVLLCFIWLKSERISARLAWFGSILFMTAGCLFHMHRQVMFVNYLPFLLLAFLCVRKKLWKWLPLCMLMICLSSFYFAISAFAAVGWYWFRTEGKRFWKGSFLKRYLPCTALAAGMAAALLIPTGLVLLEHRRGSSVNGIFTLLELFCPNPVFNNILFNEYGMGLTLICFYSILAGLQIRKIRKDSILFLLSGMFGILSYILNATLYARPKILIPFMPLAILHCVRVIKLYSTHETVPGRTGSTFPVESGLSRLKVPPLWPFAAMLPVSLLWFSQEQFPWIMAELGILFCLCVFARLKASIRLAALLQHLRSAYVFPWIRQAAAPLCILLLIIGPVGMYLTTAGTNDWVKQTELSAGFTGQELKDADLDPRWHYDSMLSPLNSANELNTGQIRSTMYSSVTNGEYSELYYDTLMTPIRINNRVALLTSPNPFMLQLLGVRYLETSADQIPAGYRVIRRSGNTVLAENENVLPSVYFTDDTVSQEWFDKQDAYDQLDIITRKTVVDDPLRPDAGTASASGNSASVNEAADTDRMHTYEPEFSLEETRESSVFPDGLTVSREDDGWEITADRDCTLNLDIKNPVSGNIVLFQFEVTNLTCNAVVIDINGIRNKLSGMFAPYPNGNNIFHYQFATDNATGVDRLEITFSKGHYRLTDIQCRLYDSTLLQGKNFTPLTDSGTVTASGSGYLATSVPMQNGLEILVDGRAADLIRVNKAFAGAYLEKGTHTIEIRFTPPGKTAGCIISAAALSGYFVWLVISAFRYVRTARRAGRRNFIYSGRSHTTGRDSL